MGLLDSILGAMSGKGDASGQAGPLIGVRDDGQRFIVRADQKITAFVELESAVRAAKT